MLEALTVNAIITWVVLSLNVVLTLALIRAMRKSGSGDPMGTSGLPAGTRAPDFTAEQLDASTLTLTPISKADYAGSPLLLLFISAACRPCREKMPHYLEAAQAAERAGVSFVMVETGSPDSAPTMIQEFGINVPLLIAPPPENTMMQDYQVQGTPSYCLIRADGVVESSGYPDPARGEWASIVKRWQRTSARPQLAFR